ncbi:MAG: Rrf2 family transcriptional regulator [Myxococcales bacterium]|nr:Rrf2 family transcriptional regulator [Myxococcales bacterium]
MRVSKEGDYALRAVLFLGGKTLGERSTKREIADSEAIPEQFLSKILQGLVRAGVVASRVGVGGGYWLARSAAEVSFLEVIEAVGGPLELNECTGDPATCSQSPHCGQMLVWRAAEEQLRGLLGRTTLASVLERSVPDGFARLEHDAR